MPPLAKKERYPEGGFFIGKTIYKKPAAHPSLWKDGSNGKLVAEKENPQEGTLKRASQSLISTIRHLEIQ